jgi:phosphate transport system substrate-binding protein
MASEHLTDAGASTTIVDRAGFLRLFRQHAASRFSGSIEVRSDAGDGRVFLHQGRIVHAESGSLAGAEAFRRMARWPRSACSLHEDVPAPRVTIVRDLLADPAARVEPPAASAAPRPAAPARRGPERSLLLLAASGVAMLALITVAALVVVRRPAAPPAPAAAPAPRLVLRVGGAKAIAEELAPALARGYLASLGLGDVRVAREGTWHASAEGTKDGERWTVAVRGTSTPEAFDALAAGALDIAMTGRRILPAWQEKAAALGNLSAPGAEHVVGLSGIAVVVNVANPVARLDAAQLAAIFGGTATRWDEVGRPGEPGAPGRPLHVYATAEDMGLTDLFRTLVLGKLPYAEGARRVASLQEMNDAVAADPDGIGFLTLPFVRGTRAVPIAEGDDPPLVPTAFTVATEDYPLTHRLYFYAPPASANPHVHRFLQFVLGPEGQEIVRRSGYVELSVAAERREARPLAPPEYAEATRAARRLTSTFRFEPSSSELDARALADVERVTRWLVDGRVDPRTVRILGFADSQGDRTRNRQLSLARAALVAKAFAQRGIQVGAVHGLGAEVPVASNATEDGRRRNRRVEVWIGE